VGKDPHAWIAAVKTCAEELRLAPVPTRPELAAKSRQELVSEIRGFEAQARRIEKKDRVAVEKERDLVVRAYSIGDVFEALDATFGQLTGDLAFTFDFELLEAEWPAVVSRLKCHPLPTEPEPGPRALLMLEELVRSLWRADNGGVTAARLAQEVLIRDYLDRLNESQGERC